MLTLHAYYADHKPSFDVPLPTRKAQSDVNVLDILDPESGAIQRHWELENCLRDFECLYRWTNQQNGQPSISSSGLRNEEPSNPPRLVRWQGQMNAVFQPTTIIALAGLASQRAIPRPFASHLLWGTGILSGTDGWCFSLQFRTDLKCPHHLRPLQDTAGSSSCPPTWIKQHLIFRSLIAHSPINAVKKSPYFRSGRFLFTFPSRRFASNSKAQDPTLRVIYRSCRSCRLNKFLIYEVLTEI